LTSTSRFWWLSPSLCFKSLAVASLFGLLNLCDNCCALLFCLIVKSVCRLSSWLYPTKDVSACSNRVNVCLSKLKTSNHVNQIKTIPQVLFPAYLNILGAEKMSRGNVLKITTEFQVFIWLISRVYIFLFLFLYLFFQVSAINRSRLTSTKFSLIFVKCMCFLCAFKTHWKST